MVVGSVCARGRVFLQRLVSGTDSTISGLCFHSLASRGIKVSRNSFRVEVAPSGRGEALAVSSGNVNVAGRRLRTGLNAVTGDNSLTFGRRGTSSGSVSIVNRFNMNFCSTFVIDSYMAIRDHTCNRDRTCH